MGQRFSGKTRVTPGQSMAPAGIKLLAFLAFWVIAVTAESGAVVAIKRLGSNLQTTTLPLSPQMPNNVHPRPELLQTVHKQRVIRRGNVGRWAESMICFAAHDGKQTNKQKKMHVLDISTCSN